MKTRFWFLCEKLFLKKCLKFSGVSSRVRSYHCGHRSVCQLLTKWTIYNYFLSAVLMRMGDQSVNGQHKLNIDTGHQDNFQILKCGNSTKKEKSIFLFTKIFQCLEFLEREKYFLWSWPTVSWYWPVYLVTDHETRGSVDTVHS